MCVGVRTFKLYSLAFPVRFFFSSMALILTSVFISYPLCLLCFAFWVIFLYNLSVLGQRENSVCKLTDSVLHFL